jgi:hypothetical protein
MFIFDPMTWGLLVLLFWAILFIAIQSKRAQKKKDEINRRFLEDDENANAVRKRPLEAELFYTAQLDRLPSLPEGDPHNVKRAAKRKMIHFPQPMTNLELKNRYGRVQLELLAHYEENYDDYLRSLTKWAEALATENNTPDAIRILEHTITLGSEFRNSYKQLADIYYNEKNTKKIDELLSAVSSKPFRDPATANHIIDYIRQRQATNTAPNQALPT